MRIARRLLTAAPLLLASCSPFPEGADDVDAREIGASDNLAHVAAALGDEGMTVYDLVHAGAELKLSERPDPTGLLDATAALDDERPAEGGTTLSVLSQNVGLLDAKIFFFFDYKRTPLLAERRDELFDVFVRDEPDVALFQEVWIGEDVERFVDAARERGYLVSVGERFFHDDGLLLAVKESIVKDGAFVDEGRGTYEHQDGLEYFPGPGIKRGYQWVRFEHVDAGEIVVFNTHMQAFAEQWANRARQARELGLAVQREAGSALAIVGGDLNSGPYYAHDERTLPDGTTQDVWFENAIAYAVLLEYGGLVDAAVMGRPVDDAAVDVRLGDTVVNDPETSVEVPGGVEGWCDQTPHLAFTASDCNSLYFAQYAGTEPPARLDHVHLRDPDGRARALSSTIVFTEKETFDGDVETEPSDHYGVLVELMIDGG